MFLVRNRSYVLDGNSHCAIHPTISVYVLFHHKLNNDDQKGGRPSQAFGDSTMVTMTLSKVYEKTKFHEHSGFIL